MICATCDNKIRCLMYGCQTEPLCPYPINGDDGTAGECVANGHCGCALGPDHKETTPA